MKLAACLRLVASVTKYGTVTLRLAYSFVVYTGTNLPLCICTGVRKIAKSDYYLRHVCPSVRIEQLGAPTRRIFMKFDYIMNTIVYVSTTYLLTLTLQTWKIW